VERVLGLAPDAASVRAARGLARPATWSEVGCTESLVFGRCQGSGREPYQVTVDLTEPAFRCTCPSRKHPCKHGLALLLLWAEHGDAVGEVTAAGEVAGFADEWQRDRAERAARTEARRTRAAAAPADPEAQARRQAQREAAMTAGLDELERALADLVRGGLAGARRQPYAFWDGMAARLVDAQVPALAERVRDVGGLIAGREDWPDVLLAEMGRWQLAIRAWHRRADLDRATHADLRVALGWPWRADEVAAFPRVDDRWVVAGVARAEDDRIASQRTWLWGEATGRWAVVLDFAAAGAALRVPQVVGSVVADAVTAHPGTGPVRVAFSGEERVVATGAAPPGLGIDAALDALVAGLASNPWRARMPLALAGVVPVAEEGPAGAGPAGAGPAGGDRWWLVDPDGARLPLAAGVDPWPLLARSAGAPVDLVVEWADGAVHPLALSTPTPAAL
jgi:hypothetical protein